MKKISFFLALALCVCFSVALSASTLDSDFAGEAEAETDVILDDEVIPDDVVPEPDNSTSEPVPDTGEPLPLPAPEPVQTHITVDNSAVVASIQGLQQSLLAGQSPDFDNMSLLQSLEQFGLELVEQTPDFALLFFSRTNSFIMVSHNTIVNLGVM